MLELSQVTGTVTLGAIWAPSANLAFDSGLTTNGQWFGQNITTSGDGEIHHYSFGGRLLCGSEPSPTPSITTPTPPTETPTAPTETPTPPTETPTAPTETPTPPTPTSTQPTGPSTGTTTPATNLPQTGSSASLTVVWVGAALVIVGLTALIGARLARRRN